MNNVENLTTAFVVSFTLGTTAWTELTYSIFYKVPGRAVIHTGVFEAQVVFFTAQTMIGFPLTRSTSRGTAMTLISLGVTSVRMPQRLYDKCSSSYTSTSR